MKLIYDENVGKEIIKFGKMSVKLEKMFFIIILFLSLIIFSLCFQVIKKTTFVGYADPAAYGEVANNLVKGRGPVQDFIDFYFTAPLKVSHLSEHWFSLYTIILVPFIALLGESAFVVKLPTLLSFFLLPLIAYLVLKKFFNCKIAFFSVLTILFNPFIIKYSINGWPDIMDALFTLIVIYFYKRSEKDCVFLLFTGAFLGLLCWFRGTGFLVMAGLGVDYLIRYRKKSFRSLYIWLAMLAFLVGFSPSVLLSLHYFNKAFVGNHQNLAATMGYLDNPQAEHWVLFWNDPPTIIKKIEQEGILPVIAKTGRELSGIIIKRNYFEENPPLVMLVSFPLFLLAIWFFIKKKNNSLRLILFFSISYIFFLSLLFKLNSRYLFTIQILIIAVGWGGFFALFPKFQNLLKKYFPSERWLDNRLIILFSAAIFLIILQGNVMVSFVSQFGKASSQYPFTDDYKTFHLFEMIQKSTTTNEIIMCSLPWSLTFHTGRRSVIIPYGTIQDMFTVCKRYGIRTFVDLTGRGRILLSKYPEFVPKKKWGKTVLYDIDFSKGRGRGLFYEQNNWILFEW